jgi:hypothetical protein
MKLIAHVSVIIYNLYKQKQSVEILSDISMYHTNINKKTTDVIDIWNY